MFDPQFNSVLFSRTDPPGELN